MMAIGSNKYCIAHLYPTAPAFIDFPKEWKPMKPNDYYLIVPVDVDSQEYSSVMEQLVLFDTNYYEFVEIGRIQNPLLYTQYMVKKRYMEYYNIPNEKRLFHGCSGDVTHKISHQGFDRGFAGTKHGKS